MNIKNMNNVKIYKNISLEIIKLFENDKLEELEKLLNKRDKILKEEINNREFKKMLIDYGILDIDLTIKKLISKNIIEVKQEIREHNLLKQASGSYMYTTKQKINIFNVKV